MNIQCQPPLFICNPAKGGVSKNFHLIAFNCTLDGDFNSPALSIPSRHRKHKKREACNKEHHLSTTQQISFMLVILKQLCSKFVWPIIQLFL